MKVLLFASGLRPTGLAIPGDLTKNFRTRESNPSSIVRAVSPGGSAAARSKRRYSGCAMPLRSEGESGVQSTQYGVRSAEYGVRHMEQPPVAGNCASTPAINRRHGTAGRRFDHAMRPA